MTQDNKPLSELEIPIDAQALQQVPKWAELGAARKEEQKWDELEETKRKHDKRWLAHYGWIVVVLTWIFAGIFAIALLCWVWHYIGPANWYWLDDARLSKIQSILFSSGMGAVVSGMVRGQLGKTQ